MSYPFRWSDELDWDPVADEAGLPAYAVRSAEEDELHAAVASGDAVRIAAIKGLIAWRDAQAESKPVPDRGMWFDDHGMLLVEGDWPKCVAPASAWTDEQWAAKQAAEVEQMAAWKAAVENAQRGE